MTTGQINIWRYCVREATFQAVYEGRKFSELPSLFKMFNAAKRQVARATFCAKWDDVPYSRLKADSYW